MKKRSVSYKATIFLGLLVLLLLVISSFAIYIYSDWKKTTRENALLETENLSKRLVQRNDEMLSNLREYYVLMAESDSIKWMLDNKVTYNNYSYYKTSYDELAGNGLFNDWILGFTFANLKTDWVLNNKGLFTVPEVFNKEILDSINQEKTEKRTKIYWKYTEPETDINRVDRNYRVTLENDGLNLIMWLPSASYNTFGFFISKINLETWKSSLTNLLERQHEIVVQEENGNIVYASNPESAAFCRPDAKLPSNFLSSQKTSNILGWKYTVFYDLSKVAPSYKFSFILVPILILFCISAVFLGFFLYSPVDNLIKEINEQGIKEKINEYGTDLNLVAGSLRTLKNDKKVLEMIVDQQQMRLMELFELRLIRGEVKAEECSEFLERFGLVPNTFFAACTVVLNFHDEETIDVVDEDALCLRILQELPQEIKSLAWMPPLYTASAIFAIFSENDEDLLLKKITDFYEGIKKSAVETTDYEILMGVSGTQSQIMRMSRAYRESLNAIASGKDSEGCNFYVSQEIVSAPGYDAHYEEEIRNGIRSGDLETCYHATDGFITYLRGFSGRDHELLVCKIRFVNTIWLTTIELGLRLQDVYPDGVVSVYRELINTAELDHTRRLIKRKCVDPIIKTRLAYLENNSYALLNRIQDLIAQKKGDITLAECADILEVHPTSIWKLLKTEKNRTFTEYTEEYQLNEAKRLLLETELSVGEIAKELNYGNPQNFIRFFSRMTGITPGKFRKLY